MVTPSSIRRIALVALIAVSTTQASVGWSRDTTTGTDPHAAYRPSTTVADPGTFRRLFPEVVARPSTASRSTTIGRSAVESVLTDSADGQFDNFSLLEAGMIVSRIDGSTTRQRCLAKVEQLIEKIANRIATHDSLTTRAELVHDILHAELLHGEYHAHASELSHVFERGSYNCVSATILYCHICRQLNIPCEVVQWRDHVACRIPTPTGPLAVETTCREWFDARRTTSAVDRASRSDYGDVVANRFAQHTTAGRRLSSVQLLALIEYNRGVEALHAQRFSDALRSSYRAFVWDRENRAAWNNCLAAVNNRALDESRRGHFGVALDLLQRGQQAAPDYATFAVNFRHVQERKQLSVQPQTSSSDFVGQ